MALHKAFVDATAKPLRHNLEVLLRHTERMTEILEQIIASERRPGAIYFQRRHRYPGGYIPPYVEDAPALV
ncbi:MAG: hypothetical protein WA624_22110 [Methylocella sp.]